MFSVLSDVCRCVKCVFLCSLMHTDSVTSVILNAFAEWCVCEYVCVSFR